MILSAGGVKTVSLSPVCSITGLNVGIFVLPPLPIIYGITEAERDALPENDQLLKNSIENKLVRCTNGVDQFL